MNNKILWGLRIIAAVIMLQTLYFKFTGAPESVYIFSTLGVEPWGRIAAGIVELISSVLLLLNTTIWIGATLAIGVMAGALLSHLTILGVDVKGDGGYLFLMAIIVFGTSAIVLWFEKNKMLEYLKRLNRNY